MTGTDGRADDTATAAIVARLMARLEDGERVDLEDEIASHPHLASALRRDLTSLCHSLQMLGQGHLATAPMPGTIAGYRLEERIGRGGEGASVFRAVQQGTGRIVALKVLPREADARMVERFRLQQHFAALDHPHVVPVLDAGESGGFHFLVMELMAGGTLASVLEAMRCRGPDQVRDLGAPLATAMGLRSDRIPDAPLHRIRRPAYVRWAVALAREVALALGRAHEAGVVHRDVKPSNLLLDADGQPHLADFGLARRVAASELTRTGETPGTRPYMSPEQFEGKEGRVDERSDVYSLGVVLYELLTLARPLAGESEAELIDAIRWQPSPDPRRINDSVPRDLGALVLKCLEKSPAYRVSSANELAAELQRFLDGSPLRTKPVRWPTRVWRQARLHPRVATGVSLAVAVMLLIVGFAAARIDEQRRLAVSSGVARVELLQRDARSAWQQGQFEHATELAEQGIVESLALLPSLGEPAQQTHVLVGLAELATLKGDAPAGAAVLALLASVPDATAHLTIEREPVRIATLLASKPAAAIEPMRALASRMPPANREPLLRRARLVEQLAQTATIELPGFVDLRSGWHAGPVPAVLVDRSTGSLSGAVALWQLGTEPRDVGRLPRDVAARGKPAIVSGGCALAIAALQSHGAQRYHCAMLMGDSLWTFRVGDGAPTDEVAVTETRLPLGRARRPAPGGLRGQLTILGRMADGSLGQVYVAVHSDGGGDAAQGDFLVDLGADPPRASPLGDNRAATGDVVRLGDDTLLAALAEWTGYGFLFLRRSGDGWLAEHLQRVGLVRAVAPVRQVDHFLLGIETAYRIDAFFGTGERVAWPPGIHLAARDDGTLPRLRSVASDTLVDPRTKYDIAVAADVAMTTTETGHVALLHDRIRNTTELRVYASTPTKTAAMGDRLAPDLTMHTTLRTVRALLHRDLDGDGDDEILPGEPEPGPALPTVTVVGMVRR